MAIAMCNTTVDGSNRELLEHGTVAFPIACYHDDLRVGAVPWHWHGELEAVVIEKGSCTVAAGKEKYVVREGEGFFVNSGILHGCWDREDSGCRFHSLVFHPRLVGGGLDSVLFQNYVEPLIQNHGMESLHLKPEISWQKAALEAIDAAWYACEQEPEGYEFLVRGHLSRLVFQLWKHLPGEEGTQGVKLRRDGERIKRMLQFIHDHLEEELNTAAIAASTSISESECLRCFRNTIGTTPIQYLRQYRIRKAVQLLRNTQMAVADICAQCGFQNVSYFTKTFREMMGCAPGEFRRKQRQNGCNSRDPGV